MITNGHIVKYGIWKLNHFRWCNLQDFDVGIFRIDHFQNSQPLNQSIPSRCEDSLYSFFAVLITTHSLRITAQSHKNDLRTYKTLYIR